MYRNGKGPWSWLLPVFLLASFTAFSQRDSIGFWQCPDRLHKGRFWTAASVGAVTYTGTLITLNGLWYDKYPRTSFHFFNDINEWDQVDKAGHMFTAYFESDWLYHVSRWTGMKESHSIIAGAIGAIGLQATIEMLDGFSSEWGFSLNDFAFNLAGSGLWAAQQSIWHEQRIRMKVSSTYRRYSTDPIQGMPGSTSSLHNRTRDFFGKNIFQTFLKDYNAQTDWMSFNISSFLSPQSRFPKWLNLAVGYGADNMFGGFKNEWDEGENHFVVDDLKYPRHRQLYLSPDVDLTRIKVKSHFLKVLLGMANVFKIPAPALEFNVPGKVKWKWLYY